MKVQLVQASLDGDVRWLDQRWFLPLGLLSVATYAGAHNESLDIEILDGMHLSTDEILPKLDADIIGVNYTILSTDSLDRIVEKAKSFGAVTAVGGQAASKVPNALLTRNPHIDAVVVGDGEKPFLELTDRVSNNKPWDGIPNLYFRENGSVVPPPIFLREQLSELPPLSFDFPGINMESYLASWDKSYDVFPGRKTRPISTYTKKGCLFDCSFCARIDKSLRTRTPRQAYEDYRRLVALGANYIYEVNDSHLFDAQQTRNWLRQFKEIYVAEGGLDAKLWFFADPRHITPETVEIMRTIGVYEVLMGFESGSREIREKIMAKQSLSNDRIVEKAGMLYDAGIRLSDSYILGLPGENDDTIKKTIELAAEIVQKYPGLVTDRAYNIMLPLPDDRRNDPLNQGKKRPQSIWEMMMGVPELRQRYGGHYEFDIGTLRLDYFRHFTSITKTDFSQTIEKAFAGAG